jgi:hypothetical protein
VDLQLFLRVFWRFRLLVLSGLVLALSLAFLSFVRVDFANGFKTSHRQQEEWASYGRLFVTQEGFLWGSSLSKIEPPANDQEALQDPLGVQRQAEVRLSTLAVVYSELVMSDEVKRMIEREAGPLRGRIEAAAVLSEKQDVLPLISIAGIASSPARARSLTRRAIASFRRYLARQQEVNAIPDEDRVILEVVRQPDKPRLLKKRSKTFPIVVFLTVMIAVSGLAFVLENLRPRIRQVPDPARLPLAETVRNSA